jgi:hypothetical protein
VLTATYGAPRHVGFGALMSRAVSNLRDIWREVLAYMAIVTVLSFALPLAGTEISGLAGLCLYLAGQYWLFRKLLRTRGLLESQRIHPFAFVGLAAILIVPIVLGIALLVVPGLFLAARTIAAPAFVVARGDNALTAISGSWNAVRGHSGKLMGALALMFLAVSALGSVTTGLDRAMGYSAVAGETGPISVIQIHLLPLLMLGLSVATYELLGPEDTTIEEVFG